RPAPSPISPEGAAVTTTTAESVKEALGDVRDRALVEARDRLGEAKELIVPKVADALGSAAERLPRDLTPASVKAPRQRSVPRWLLITVTAAAATGVLLVVSRMRSR